MKFLSALGLVLLLATLCEANGCPVSTCSTADRNLEMLWLNTSSMMASIKGTTIVFYPRQPNGDIYELMQASLSIDVVGEITHDSNNTCNTQSMFFINQYVAAKRVPRYLSLDSACCAVSTISDIMDGNIARERVLINVTYPSWPDFYLEYTVSTYNDTNIIQKPATPNIGSGYNISMMYVESEQIFPPFSIASPTFLLIAFLSPQSLAHPLQTSLSNTSLQRCFIEPPQRPTNQTRCEYLQLALDHG